MKFYRLIVEIGSIVVTCSWFVMLYIKWFVQDTLCHTKGFVWNLSRDVVGCRDTCLDLTIGQKLIGFCVEAVSVALFLVGLIYFIHVLRLFQKGEIFSQRTVTLFHIMSKLMMWRALYAPVEGILLSLVTTFHNPPGQRLLVMTLGSEDLVNIIICIFFVVITSVMRAGCALKDEYDLTV